MCQRWILEPSYQSYASALCSILGMDVLTIILLHFVPCASQMMGLPGFPVIRDSPEHYGHAFPSCEFEGGFCIEDAPLVTL